MRANRVTPAEMPDTCVGTAELGASHLRFQPTSGFPSVGLKTVAGKPLQLTSGKWYYEVTIGDGRLCNPQFGWCDERYKVTTPNDGVGDDAFSWGIDGDRRKKFHTPRPDLRSVYNKLFFSRGGEDWGQSWKAGDIVGCMADLDAETLSFSLNGSTDAPMGVAFEDIDFHGGLFPALAGSACDVTCNFGEDPLTPLRHQPEGYFPVVPPARQGAGTQPTGRLEPMHDNRKTSPWLQLGT